MKKLALIFPGIGYGFDRPLLYYSQKLAKSRGYEVRQICLQVSLDRTLPNLRRMEQGCEQAVRQAETILSAMDLSPYQEILLIGKSIGTVAAASVGAFDGFPVRTHSVLYTPLAQTFRLPLHNAAVFTGTADPWVKPGEIPALCDAAQIPCYLHEGANHSLETGDVMTDLEILRSCMERTDALLSRD